MKINFDDTNKSFAKRLLNDFSKGLFELLQEKKLESITVARLCEKTNYPRSTFYNYFDDIYDLMNYCWEVIAKQIHITDFQNIEHDKRTLEIFNMVYDYMDSNRSSIEKLLKHNPIDGAMLLSLDRFIKETIYYMVTECPFSYKYPVPYEIIAKHYSNTVQMILSACFLDKTITKKEALSYMNFLLGTLEKESTRK